MPNPGDTDYIGFTPADPAYEIDTGPRLTWAAAGGALPTLTAGDVGGGAVDAVLGTSPTQNSSFAQIGSECFASCRIIAGADAVGLTGSWLLTGLPVAPAVTGGHGRVVGHGFMVNPGAPTTLYHVKAVLDPYFHLTKPCLFVFDKLSAGDWLAPDFASIEPLCHDANPFDFVEGKILNLTLQYEAA